MKTLSFDPIRADVAITEKEKSAALHANALLHNGQGAGNDFLGWVGLPSALDEEELQAIETEAARLRDQVVKLRVQVEGGSEDDVLKDLKKNARKGSAYGNRKNAAYGSARRS